MEDSLINYNLRPSYMDVSTSGQGRLMPPPPAPFDSAVKKKLSEEFLDPDDPSAGGDKVKTFLRIRPPSSRQAIDPGLNKNVYSIEDDNVLVVRPLNKKNTSMDITESRFSFSHVFGPDSSQSSIFDECVLKLVDGLFNGDCGLIFSYGATNSGKTYTMQGYGKDFGVVPRTLEYLFNRLDHFLYKKGDIKPNQFDGHMILDDSSRKAFAEIKQNILRESKIKPADISHFTESICRSSSSMCSSTGLHEPQEILGLEETIATNANDTVLSDTSVVAGQPMYCIWVSFAEIYNERVFDLFETIQKGKKRKELKLYQDKDGRVYINDLTECCAHSAEEAYQLFLAGKQNLHFAKTQANMTSSRSHSFFNIRMVVIGKSGAYVYPKQVYRFSFCDLAGIERVSQTGNVGARLKESGSINQSLIVLLRCIRALRDRQDGKKSNMEVIPFRDSKLAWLFKSYLTTATQVSMIVNVNPDPEMIESSLFVLQNSALASSIRTHKKIEPPANDTLFCRKIRASLQLELLPKVKALRENCPDKTEFETESEGEDENETPEPENQITVKRRIGIQSISKFHNRILALETENKKLQRDLRMVEDDVREKVHKEFDILLNKERERFELQLYEEARRMANFSNRRMSLAARALDSNPGILNVSNDDRNMPSPGGLSTALDGSAKIKMLHASCVVTRNTELPIHSLAGNKMYLNAGEIHDAVRKSIPHSEAQVNTEWSTITRTSETNTEVSVRPVVDCTDVSVNTIATPTFTTGTNTVAGLSMTRGTSSIVTTTCAAPTCTAAVDQRKVSTASNTVAVFGPEFLFPKILETRDIGTYTNEASDGIDESPAMHTRKSIGNNMLCSKVTNDKGTNTEAKELVDQVSSTDPAAETQDSSTNTEAEFRVESSTNTELKATASTGMGTEEFVYNVTDTIIAKMYFPKTVFIPNANSETNTNTNVTTFEEVEELKKTLCDAQELCIDYHKKLALSNSNNEKLTQDYNKLAEEKMISDEDQECLHLTIESLTDAKAELEAELAELKKQLNILPKSKPAEGKNYQPVGVSKPLPETNEPQLDMEGALDDYVPAPAPARRTASRSRVQPKSSATAQKRKTRSTSTVILEEDTTTENPAGRLGNGGNQKKKSDGVVEAVAVDSDSDSDFVPDPKRKKTKATEPLVSTKTVPPSKSGKQLRRRSGK